MHLLTVGPELRCQRAQRPSLPPLALFNPLKYLLTIYPEVEVIITRDLGVKFQIFDPEIWTSCTKLIYPRHGEIAHFRTLLDAPVRVL